MIALLLTAATREGRLVAMVHALLPFAFSVTVVPMAGLAGRLLIRWPAPGARTIDRRAGAPRGRVRMSGPSSVRARSRKRRSKEWSIRRAGRSGDGPPLR